jgi:hypothetical protein
MNTFQQVIRDGNKKEFFWHKTTMMHNSSTPKLHKISNFYILTTTRK